MGVVVRMPNRKNPPDGAVPKPAGERPGVVVHPGANLRDVERLMKYIKTRDDRSGRY